MHLNNKSKPVCFVLYSVFTVFQFSQNRMHLNNKSKPVCFVLYSVFTVFLIDAWAKGRSEGASQAVKFT